MDIGTSDPSELAGQWRYRSSSLHGASGSGRTRWRAGTIPPRTVTQSNNARRGDSWDSIIQSIHIEIRSRDRMWRMGRRPRTTAPAMPLRCRPGLQGKEPDKLSHTRRRPVRGAAAGISWHNRRGPGSGRTPSRPTSWAWLYPCFQGTSARPTASVRCPPARRRRQPPFHPTRRLPVRPF